MDKKNKKMNMEIFDYSTIPKFMQEHGRFCLWKLVMKLGKTKADKIPYQFNGKMILTISEARFILGQLVNQQVFFYNFACSIETGLNSSL